MSFIERFKEQLSGLYEGLDNVKSQYGEEWHQTLNDIYNHVLPKGDKSDRLLHHAVKILKNDNFHPDHYGLSDENIEDLKDKYHLIAHFNLKSHLGNIDSYEKLHSFIKPYKEKYDNILAAKSSPIVYEDDTCIVKSHDTHQSARIAAELHPDNPEYHKLKLPGKAAWCVSATNESGKHYYNNYTDNSKHKMYTFENKANKKRYAIIGNHNNSLLSLEIRDEYDNKIPPDFFEKNYPHILDESNKNSFSDFLRHVKINKEVDQKIIKKEVITGSDFDNIMKHDKTNYNEYSENPVGDFLPEYDKLEKSHNVTKFYSHFIANDIGKPNFQAKILNNFDIPSDTINSYIERSRSDASERNIGAAVAHKNADSKYAQNIINHFTNGGGDFGMKYAVKHPSVTRGQIASLLHNHIAQLDDYIIKNLLNHPKTTSGQVKTFVDNNVSRIGRYMDTYSINDALNSSNLNNHDLHDIINKHSDKLEEGHILSAMDNTNGDRELHKKLRIGLLKKNPLNAGFYVGSYASSLNKHPPTIEEYQNEIKEGKLTASRLEPTYDHQDTPDIVKQAIRKTYPGAF